MPAIEQARYWGTLAGPGFHHAAIETGTVLGYTGSMSAEKKDRTECFVPGMRTRGM